MGKASEEGNGEVSREDIAQARHLHHQTSDDTKVWLAICSVVGVFIVVAGILIWSSNNNNAALRQAACVNPETVACALAARR